MPLLQKYQLSGGTLLLWEMTETPEEMKVLAKEFTNESAFLQITNPKRQKEWLAVRMLLTEAACSPEQISYDSNGKPMIDHAEFKSISISHSSQLAGIYLHPLECSGLDIESTTRDFLKVEKKYLSPEESVLAHKIENGHALFWCIKEAVYKACGVPGLIFCEQIRINQSINGELTTVAYTPEELSFQIKHVKIGDQLVVYITLLKK